MLRVSYHGIVLAWGLVPRFCVDGRSLRRRRSASVASVVATVQGFVMLEELRKMIAPKPMLSGVSSSTLMGVFLDWAASAAKRTCSKASRRRRCLHAPFRGRMGLVKISNVFPFSFFITL
jgi:hypothetical protein